MTNELFNKKELAKCSVLAGVLSVVFFTMELKAKFDKKHPERKKLKNEKDKFITIGHKKINVSDAFRSLKKNMLNDRGIWAASFLFSYSVLLGWMAHYSK